MYHIYRKEAFETKTLRSIATIVPLEVGVALVSSRSHGAKQDLSNQGRMGQDQERRHQGGAVLKSRWITEMAFGSLTFRFRKLTGS